MVVPKRDYSFYYKGVFKKSERVISVQIVNLYSVTVGIEQFLFLIGYHISHG